jgi:UDP-2-acetamido-2-deoxy-ribo-hexuluronate aminotransferase
LQAAVLLEKLKILDEELIARQRVADTYTRLLTSAGVTTTPYVGAGNVSAWAQYTVQVANRDHVQKVLAEAGIPTAVHYPTPLNRQPAVASDAELPVGDTVAERVLSLPMHPYLTEQIQLSVVEHLAATLRVTA